MKKLLLIMIGLFIGSPILFGMEPASRLIVPYQSPLSLQVQVARSLGHIHDFDKLTSALESLFQQDYPTDTYLQFLFSVLFTSRKTYEQKSTILHYFIETWKVTKNDMNLEHDNIGLVLNFLQAVMTANYDNYNREFQIINHYVRTYLIEENDFRINSFIPDTVDDIVLQLATDHNFTLKMVGGFTSQIPISILRLACFFNLPSVVHYLLEFGANPNINEKNVQIPLLIQSIQMGYHKVSDLLIQFGSKLENYDLPLFDPVIMASLFNRQETMQVLLKHVDINHKNPSPDAITRLDALQDLLSTGETNIQDIGFTSEQVKNAIALLKTAGARSSSE